MSPTTSLLAFHHRGLQALDNNGIITTRPSDLAVASRPIPKEASGCAYGLVNLEPCPAIHLDPLASLGNYRGSMHTDCAQNGYDAYIARVNPGSETISARTKEEVFLTPLGIARKLPDDILQLAGCYKAVGGVGYMEDHQNPVEYLQAQNIRIGNLALMLNKLTI
ncbi:hypothetical protein DL767_000450 [Monosporascus sp. MG133]|nr:hypothetical protein DL767_000450 [Monosporascus sp. MG133]